MFFSSFLVSAALASSAQAKTLNDVRFLDCHGENSSFAHIDLRHSPARTEFKIGSLPQMTNVAEQPMPVEVIKGWPNATSSSIGGLVVDGGQTVFGNASVIFTSAQAENMQAHEHGQLIFIDQAGQSVIEAAHCEVSFEN